MSPFSVRTRPEIVEQRLEHDLDLARGDRSLLNRDVTPAASDIAWSLIPMNSRARHGFPTR
jgi:hypothetical protein